MTIIISHRANLNGPDGLGNNTKSGVLKALAEGFDVELDLWYCSEEEAHQGLWLGHGTAVEPVMLDWLYQYRYSLWMHCKVKRAATLIKYSLPDITDVNWFMHHGDSAVLTSTRLFWVYPGSPLGDGRDTVAVLPETTRYTLDQLSRCLAVCTDYPFILRKFLKDYEDCDCTKRTHKDVEEDYQKFLERVLFLKS